MAKAKRSQRWKDLERATAKALGGNRILRGSDFSKSEPDVDIEDMPRLKVDCKAHKRFAHHTLLQEVKEKYCKRKNDIPILVTKHEHQVGACVTISLDFFSELLEEWYQSLEDISGEW